MNDTPINSLPPGATNVGRIDAYRGWGDRLLRYRIVASDSPRFSLVYLHGIESHGTWFLPVAAKLARHGCTTYLLDRRGSGLNREPAPGDAPGVDALIADVQHFRAHHGNGALHLAALSWGGKLALAAALAQPEYWQSLTLITPGLRAKVDLSLGRKFAVAMNIAVGGGGRFAVPLCPEMFTTTPQSLQFIREDPWRLTCVTARFLRASRELDQRIAHHTPPLPTPLLVILAEHDRIIDNNGVTALVQRVQPRATVTVFPAA
ncbi:MAG: lysophospholipase, partial [Phycisphaerales bacterium]|nr:lysophospholipase [Phycisphaerales bacterium]